MQGGDNRPVPTPAWRERTADRLEVRRRDPSVLAAPSLPAADAFGYPPARTVHEHREPLLARAEAGAALAHAVRPGEDTRKLLGWIRTCRTWPEGCGR